MPRWAEGQRLAPEHVREFERGVKMGKEGIAARHLPFQRVNQTRFINRRQPELVYSSEMFGRRFAYLCCGRKMDKPVGQVDRRAMGFACVPEALPLFGFEQLVDHGPALGVNTLKGQDAPNGPGRAHSLEMGLALRVRCVLLHTETAMTAKKKTQKDAYDLILEAIDIGIYGPGDRLVESDLAERFGVSRTPIREALQRLETQSLLTRTGRSLIVASLDHSQLADLYLVRAELEGLASRLAAQHATPEEVRVLDQMVDHDFMLVNDPEQLSRRNRRFHKQIHLASHNSYLIAQLELVHRSMALLATTSLAADGRGVMALAEHRAIVAAITARDGEQASDALKKHLSFAFETRLKLDAGEIGVRS